MNFEWYKTGDEKKDEKKDGKYEGEIKNGKPNGQGTFTYGKRNGKETSMKGNGRMDIERVKEPRLFLMDQSMLGNSRMGKEMEKGTYTYPYGDKYVGEFKDGKPLNVTGYDKNGTILMKWVNGVLQK